LYCRSGSILPERFDFAWHKDFMAQTQRAMEQNVRQIELDFSRVVYLDSSALGMMVLLNKKAGAVHRKVVIRGAHGASLDILQVANMQKLFDFC